MIRKNDIVELENNFDKWKLMFQGEKEILSSLFGEFASSIIHIGSTSIDNLKSKPIVDIAVGVENIDRIEILLPKLKKHYKIKIKKEDGEILLIKEKHHITHFLIHVMEINSQRYKNVVLFKHCLESDPHILHEYEELKINLANKYHYDRKGYTRAKGEFINKILLEIENHDL